MHKHVLQAKATVTGTTEATLVAAPGAGQKIVVLALYAYQGSGVGKALTLQGGAITLPFATRNNSAADTNGSANLEPGQCGLYTCTANTALVVDSTEAVTAVDVFVRYVIEPA
jgi:hypothetical protein